MKTYWTDFAKVADPSSASGPLWPRFTAADQQVLSLDSPQPTVETILAAEHKCTFWAGL